MSKRSGSRTRKRHIAATRFPTLAAVTVLLGTGASPAASAASKQTFSSMVAVPVDGFYQILQNPTHRTETWAAGMFHMSEFSASTQDRFDRDCKLSACSVRVEGVQDPANKVITPDCVTWWTEIDPTERRACVTRVGGGG